MTVAKCGASDLPDAIRIGMHRHSLYTSPLFADLWQCHRGVATCWVCREDDQITAILVGVEFGKGALARFQSMPDGLYTRVFSQGSEPGVRGRSVHTLAQAIRQAGYAKVFLSDFYGELGPLDGYQALESETVRVAISALNWEPPDTTIRSEIRKAEREAGSIEKFDAQQHMAEFLHLMRQTESRHKRKPKYDNEFYAALAELAARDGHIRWLVTEQNGSLAASHIYLIDGESALYWQSFFDKKYSFLKPNQHMLYRTAVELASQGVKLLNLGASPADAEGLRSYKEKWGGTAKSYPLYVRKSWIGKIL